MLPPISLVLATWSKSYIEALTATRYRGRPDSSAAHEGLNQWIALFAAASRRAVDDATAFERRVAKIEEHWRVALGRIRAGSAVELLVGALPGAPIVSVSGAAEFIGRSFQAANDASSTRSQRSSDNSPARPATPVPLRLGDGRPPGPEKSILDTDDSDERMDLP
jgi:hypothetical protein